MKFQPGDHVICVREGFYSGISPVVGKEYVYVRESPNGPEWGKFETTSQSMSINWKLDNFELLKEYRLPDSGPTPQEIEIALEYAKALGIKI